MSDTTIGGTVTADRNLISGNQLGIQITNAGTGPYAVPADNVILGNYIGTDVTGKKALPNATDGVMDIRVLVRGHDRWARRHREHHRLQRRHRGERGRRVHSAELDLRQRQRH